MKRAILSFLSIVALAAQLCAQTALDVPKPEEKEKAERAEKKTQEKIAQRAAVIEFHGQQTFTEKDLRSQLKEQIATIDQYGLTAARADDLAFFLELVYRKHGFAKVNVRYTIESGDRLRLDVNEGPRITLGKVIFEGNEHQPADKLFDFAVGPTRERYSRLEKTLPFVEADLREGADLVRRLYVAEGFLEVTVNPPQSAYRDDTVDVTIPIHEGKQYFFGSVTFGGQKIYDAETLRGQIVDLLQRPYTEARVADIPRRLQAYFKSRGYYDVKITATGEPEAASDGHVRVQVAISAGPLYRFGDQVTVNGLQRLRSSYVTKRFTRLRGKTYSPEALDERFRTLMQTGLFNVLQINPVPAGDDLLRLEIAAEEAKPKEFGVSIGYGTFPGAIFGVQYRDRDIFGYGRPVTTSVEISQRSYKGEILYEDPFFFDTDFAFKARVGALTFDFDGYSKFEIGGRLELTRKIVKQDEAGVVFTARHVDVTSEGINPIFLGPTSYFVNALGFTNTLDFRDSPLVSPRGFVVNNTLDLALNAFGSDIEFVRTTARVGYYLPFGPKPLTPGVVGDVKDTPLQRWFHGSSIAFGARGGLIHSLTNSGADEATEIPIDERFFNGGNTTVRSFGERDLGPHDPKGNPIGGEFFTVFNAEYTFPILGELQGALFADAGNLLPSSEHPSFDQMRYGLGMGLRYKLPIGPIRLDYGFNPDPHEHEDPGAFHFSFGFAF
jgi:outer membrane protein insertion porin family